MNPARIPPAARESPSVAACASGVASVLRQIANESSGSLTPNVQPGVGALGPS